jgi:hypothetical protein
VSRRKHGGDVVVDVLFFAFRLVWLLLLAVVLLARVLLILAVPRERRSAYRQKHGRESAKGRKSAEVSKRQDRVVKAADRNRCLARHLGGCEGEPRGRWFYEVDHGVPWIAGGYTWLPNLFLLCFFHNQTKCNYNVDKDGYVHYRKSSYGGVYDPVLAAQILAAERRARRNPMRLVRALWAL